MVVAGSPIRAQGDTQTDFVLEMLPATVPDAQEDATGWLLLQPRLARKGDSQLERCIQ